VAVEGDRQRRMVLLGAPGCGKGTQAALLAEHFGIPAISTGEVLREAVAEGSELGRMVGSVMAAGELVDDELMAKVVRERLMRADVATGFLLDGYPRTSPQAATLEGILEELGSPLDRVALMVVPEEVLLSRALGRGRADDSAEVIRERLRVYRAKTEPLVGYYRDKGLLCEVDGDQSIEEVNRQLVLALS
jgi:adenylate kinase